MKQFKKWDKTVCNTCDDSKHRDLPCGECEQLRHAGWEAALEWASNEIRHNANGLFRILEELETPDGRNYTHRN